MGGAINDEPSEPVSANRWRRYGMDRLYVNESDGQTIGWFDLESGVPVIQLADRAEAFEIAVAGWMDMHPELRMSGAANGVPDGSGDDTAPFIHDGTLTPCERHDASRAGTTTAGSSATDEPCLDLAKNLPGQTLRTLAIAEQQKRPVWTWLNRVLRVHTNERAWRMGEKGEMLVAKKLAELGNRWHVLHSIPIGDKGSDIDHLVIGPGGVFSLNTKHHKNASIRVAGEKFMVNRRGQPYIRNSRFEAERVTRLLGTACDLEINVRGVVVVVNARQFEVREAPGDVHVVNRSRLREWFVAQPLTLNETLVERIFAVARCSSTWTSSRSRRPWPRST